MGRSAGRVDDVLAKTEADGNKVVAYSFTMIDSEGSMVNFDGWVNRGDLALLGALDLAKRRIMDDTERKWIAE